VTETNQKVIYEETKSILKFGLSLRAFGLESSVFVSAISLHVGYNIPYFCLVFCMGIEAHFKAKPRVKMLRHFACQMLLV